MSEGSGNSRVLLNKSEFFTRITGEVEYENQPEKFVDSVIAITTDFQSYPVIKDLQASSTETSVGIMNHPIVNRMVVEFFANDFAVLSRINSSLLTATFNTVSNAVKRTSGGFQPGDTVDASVTVNGQASPSVGGPVFVVSSDTVGVQAIDSDELLSKVVSSATAVSTVFVSNATLDRSAIEVTADADASVTVDVDVTSVSFSLLELTAVLGETTADVGVDITETQISESPVWSQDPISSPGDIPNATESVAYSEDLSSYASDPDLGDVITFSLFSGPLWASVSAAGVLSGTPQPGDSALNNQCTVVVTDYWGNEASVLVDLTVDP